MAKIRAALLVDDGELDDIQGILETLEIDYERLRGSAVPSGVDPPTDLLVSTPRRIHAVQISTDDIDIDPPTRVVVVNEDSNSLRAQLREIGFDYLVRRPVHPEALRLLIAHCVYRGEERRGEPRVPVGFEISFRTGVVSRRATLADLSTRGCRLLSPYPLAAGKRVCVTIPEELGAAEPLAIEGTILRNQFDEHLGLDGLYAAAVEFEEVDPEIRNELEWILEDKVTGPPTLTAGTRARAERSREVGPSPGPSKSKKSKRRTIRETVSASCPPDPRSEGSPAAAELNSIEDVTTASELTSLDIDVNVKMAPPIEAVPTDKAQTERRTSDRRPYGVKVPAFGTRALRVLVGRDLSVGGMRIEYNADLERGDRLHLAIYGAAGEEPLLVWGTLTRDDRDQGMGIEFDEVHPSVAEHLEKLIGSLPSVESLHDDEISAMGTVLTEIIDS